MPPLLRFTLDLFEAAPAADPTTGISGPLLPGDPNPLNALITPASFRHPRANREARLCDALVAYEFKRGKRRTIGFSVGPDGLVVRAPNWVPLQQVDSALREKAEWVIKKLAESRERHDRLESARIAWHDGTSIPFLGQSVRVVLDPQHAFQAAGAELQPDPQRPTLSVGLPQSATPEQIRDVVQAWLMRQARRLFTERLDHFAPQLQVRWQKLSLSNAGTRWGSARVDGAIRLNWRLIHFRLPIIDYVVAHELSHLREMNHSPRFWDTVRSVVPDYLALRNQLQREATPRWP